MSKAAAAEPPKPATPSFLPDAVKPMRMIGTAFNSYILVEYDNNLLLIDQQGVHERLLFDRMMKSLGTDYFSQELLIPLILPATRKEQQLLEAHQELLQGIGLTVESFGDTEVSIRAIPMILGQPQAGDFLREILDQLEGERGVISMEKRRAAIVALASKKAVRSNRVRPPPPPAGRKGSLVRAGKARLLPHAGEKRYDGEVQAAAFRQPPAGGCTG